MSLDERTVSAMEQMVAAFDHIRGAVPALSGLRGMVANMRIHVHEARMLLVEPEVPVVHAEDPPKIEDIHGEPPPVEPAPEPDHGDPPAATVSENDVEPAKPEKPADKPAEPPKPKRAKS